ncbi:MAG: ATP-binding cassette domain-containing protein [Planctomycetota bacterium]|nr:ATP-binding cassette domain-containing protein [Planctomycetota bacterium]
MTEEGTAGDLLRLSRLSLRRNGREILREVDWQADRGSHWAVIGANGSGKTTLLRIVTGVLFPSSGEAQVLGCRFGASDLLALRRRIGWVSSALQARMPPDETAKEIVLSGLQATFGLVYQYDRTDASLADERLSEAGLSDRADTPFGVLSQGEQQRTLFARARMANPEILVLDEACAGLDLRAREEFLTHVGVVARRGGASVILVTHHLEEIPPAITHALVLREGRVLASGPIAACLTSESLSQAFRLQVNLTQRQGRFTVQVEGMA